MEIVNIKPKYLKLILTGKKKIEFRSWYSEEKYFALVSTKTKRTEAIMEVAAVLDMNELAEEDRETVLDEAFVSQSFRKKYNCRYAYMIEEVTRVH